jgi:hypothetical protein
MGFMGISRWVIGSGIALAVGWMLSRAPFAQEKRRQIALLFFANWFYLVSLLAFWPVITVEDHLPWFAASMLFVVPLLFWFGREAVPRFTPILGGVFALIEVGGILAMALPAQDDAHDKIGMVADTLKLTTPNDFVMDSKGETIYRRRPFRYVLESRTFQRLQRGLITNDISDRLIQTHTPLATLHRMPPETRVFIRANYIAIAYRLRVAGKVVRNEAAVGERCSFEVIVPQRYALITPFGFAEGTLDDTPLDVPRELAAGTHVFIPSEPTGRIVLIWAHALECDYSPFAEIKRSITTAQD